MSSRARMAVAMARGVPDRTPVMCQLALGHYFLQTAEDPVEIWHDSEAFARALVQLQRRYGFDGILVNLPGRDPDWRRHIASVRRTGSVQRVRWRDGTATVVPDDDNPRVLRDGVRPRVPFAALDPERLFYVEPHDPAGPTWPHRLGFADTPAPPDARSFFPPWQCATLRAVRRLAGDEVSIHAEVMSPFSQLMELCDHQSVLLALALEPDRVDAVLEPLAAGAARLAELYANAGCDAVLVSSAFVGGGFVSRAHYARFEQPWLRRIVGAVKARRSELPVYVHTCGKLGDRLDLVEAAGVDGIDTLDPPPLGSVDFRTAREQLGTRVFVKGNLDPVREVLECRPEDTFAAARARLSIAAADGAFILSTACSVPPHAPPENVAQLRAAVEDRAG